MSTPAQGRLGPYSIDRRLGSGGMGEVYRAWDQRLERYVALKRLRAGGSPDERASLLREARAAARVRHPGIVQIHDVVSAPEGDAIVMEWIEGATLAELARGRALPLGTVLEVVGQVAEALQAAHALGLVHRDLKAENVMLGADGRPKVLDFGLARPARPEPGEGASEAGTASLPEGSVVGTFRAMSPEQARGLRVDFRSDLFALGVLLYELLAGRSPFAGPTPTDTLLRVCLHEPEPLLALRPDAPLSLAALVARLLEKDPSRRPASAGEVAAELRRLSSGGAEPAPEGSWRNAATGYAGAPPPPAPTPGSRARALARLAGPAAALALAAVLLAAHARWRPTPLLAVAVLRPAVLTPHPEDSEAEVAQAAAEGLRLACLRAILSLERLVALSPELVDAVRGAPAAVARGAGADELLTLTLDCRSRPCRATLARLGADGRLLWTDALEVPLDRPRAVAEAVQGTLGHAWPGRGPRPGVRPLEAVPEDYARYLELRRGFDARGQASRDLDRLPEELQALRGRAPRFLDLWAFEAEVLLLRFSERRDPLDLQRATDLLRQLGDLAPGDPRVPALSFEVAVAAGDLARAATALEALEVLQPGDPQVPLGRARLALRAPRLVPEDVRRELREALARRPSWMTLFRAAQIEDRLGAPSAARAYLEQLLERVPEHYDGRSLLAELELLKGRPQRAEELYAALVQESPGVTEMANLGLARMLAGRHGEAAETLLAAAALEPRNPFVALNLADALLLSGQSDAARRAYLGVLELARQDPRAEDWHVLSVAAQAHAHLGDAGAAVEATQRLLRAAGEDPQAAADASVVYALVGDRASAAVNAARARRGGVGEAWFRLPWFAPLAGDVAFEAALGALPN